MIEDADDEVEVYLLFIRDWNKKMIEIKNQVSTLQIFIQQKYQQGKINLLFSYTNHNCKHTFWMIIHSHIMILTSLRLILTQHLIITHLSLTHSGLWFTGFTGLRAPRPGWFHQFCKLEQWQQATLAWLWNNSWC